MRAAPEDDGAAVVRHRAHDPREVVAVLGRAQVAAARDRGQPVREQLLVLLVSDDTTRSLRCVLSAIRWMISRSKRSSAELRRPASSRPRRPRPRAGRETVTTGRRDSSRRSSRTSCQRRACSSTIASIERVMACPLATDDTRRAVLVKGTLAPVSPTARRSLAVLALVAAFAAARGPLHRATFALPVSNDDAILLLMGRHVLGGELATTLWNQPYNGALDAYLLAPLLAVLPHHAAYRLYEALGARAPRRPRGPAGAPPRRAGRRVGGGAPRGLGDALHGAHDGHGPAAELPDAARHRLPARRGPGRAAAPGPARGARRRPSASASSAASPSGTPRSPSPPSPAWRRGSRSPACGRGFASSLAFGRAASRSAPRRSSWRGAIGASGAKVVTASSAVTALRPRWLWGQGVLDLGHALRGLAGLQVPLVVDGKERADLPAALVVLLAAGLLVAVAAGCRIAARAAAPRLGGGAGRGLLALAAHRPRRAALPLRPERARPRPGRGRPRGPVGVAPARGAWRRASPSSCPWGYGERVLAERWRDPAPRRARVGGAVPAAAPRRAAERSGARSAYASLQFAGRITLETRRRA